MLSKGQRDDAIVYMGTGTSLVWLLGGLTLGWALPVLAACGAGFVLNQQTGKKEPLPEPPPVVDATMDGHVEAQLNEQYGKAAVFAYRENRASGQNPQIACRSVIYDILQLQNRQ